MKLNEIIVFLPGLKSVKKVSPTYKKPPILWIPIEEN